MAPPEKGLSHIRGGICSVVEAVGACIDYGCGGKPHLLSVYKIKYKACFPPFSIVPFFNLISFLNDKSESCLPHLFRDKYLITCNVKYNVSSNPIIGPVLNLQLGPQKTGLDYLIYLFFHMYMECWTSCYNEYAQKPAMNGGTIRMRG